MRKHIKRINSPAKGRSKAHHRHELCFHSLRHYVVSTLRSNPDFSADVVRDGVGHSSEEVFEYFFAYEGAKVVKFKGGVGICYLAFVGSFFAGISTQKKTITRWG